MILGRKENISHLLGKVGFEFIEEDLLQTEAMRDIFKDRKFDMVYHLACLLYTSMERMGKALVRSFFSSVCPRGGGCGFASSVYG